MRRLLTARQLVTAGQVIEHPWILVEGDTIAGIGTQSSHDLPEHAELFEYPDATIAPAFVDIHVHGAAGHDVMEATPEALATVGRFFASRGVGAYLPTTVTAPIDQTLRTLEGLASVIERGSTPGIATPLGVHLEGPFLSHAKRGVHPAELLQPPSVALFDRFWQAARGAIRLVTVAPELPGAPEMIEHAAHLGVRVSLGHTNATAAEARAGIAAGARSATHTFNAMRALDHREPGVAAVVLDDPTLYAELICDGIHVDPAMVRLFAKAKDPDRAILVTDGISATGMPEGRYMLGGLEVEVRDGRCLLDGVLAGSVLTMDRAVRNYAAYTGSPLSAAVQLATANPAALAGAEHRYGLLAEGRRADLVVLDRSGEVLATMLGGSF